MLFRPPELPEHLRETLRHPDLRVQQAAITALLKSSAGGRGEVLASALPKLHAGVLEMALDELTVLKDPWSVEHLHALILMKKKFKAGVLEKAVVALAAISSDRAAHALYKIIGDTEQPASVRKAAVSGLSNHPSGAALEWVSKLNDPASEDALSASDYSAGVPTGVPDNPVVIAQVSPPAPQATA